MAVICGFEGCQHRVKVRGECGNRPCPKNTGASAAASPWAQLLGTDQGQPPAECVDDPFAPEVDETPSATGWTAAQVWDAQQQAAELFDLPADTPLDDLRFVVVDVETSTLKPEQGHVVQVGAVTVNGKGEVLERWSSYVKPADGNVGRSDLHGVTDEHVADAPTFEEILPELQARCQHKVEVGHNWTFDRRWLDVEMQRVGADPSPPAAIDTLQLARRAQLDYPLLLTVDENAGRKTSPNQLGNLCRYYGITLDDWHNAEADCAATGQLLPHLLEEHDLRTVGDLTERLWDTRQPLVRNKVPDYSPVPF